tara:strand:+ start:2985 stop:3494 length:510 start_codon:yes stop_codon:yes gene_type:complete
MNPQKLITKLTRAVLILTVMVFALLFTLLYHIYFSDTVEQEHPPVCGVIIELPYDLESKEDYRMAANFIQHDFSPQNGERLTKENCIVCHKLSDHQLVGPPLYNLINTLPKQENWLLYYLSNSDSLFNAGDTHAIALREAYPNSEWNHTLGSLNPTELVDIAGFVAMVH